MPVLDFIDEELAELTRQGRLRVPRVVSGPQGTRIRLDGQSVVSFSSNDYLGLAGDTVLRSAAMAELNRSGTGAGASRLIVGNMTAHVALEAELAVLLRTEGACLFNTGYAANTGVLPILAEQPDAIFSDQLNHASIIDGCRLSRATVEVFPHRDYADLEARLSRSTARRKVVVTESVFSMDGDLADLVLLRELTQRHGAILMVDEAHGVGVLGATGGGLLELLDVRADVVIATLGKAVGVAGACVAGSKSLVQLLWNRARPLVFSTGLPAAVAAAALASVKMVRGGEGDRRRVRLARNLDMLGELAPTLVGANLMVPVRPLIVGDDREVMRWTEHLLGRGVFVQGIRPPTVPEGTARLRIAVSAGHEAAEISRLAEALFDGQRQGLRVSRETAA